MPPQSFKSDTSFFDKLVRGVIGIRHVIADLNACGHDMQELENGATDTKIWKDVKRKRVRMLDLVCTKCGLRVESRAKNWKVRENILAMSHSPTDADRAWDFGMVDSDVIAFPLGEVKDESAWSVGLLKGKSSYWHERDRKEWESHPYINYFRVQSFRKTPSVKVSTKGAGEGSETFIRWNAVFAPFDGTVSANKKGKIDLGPESAHGVGRVRRLRRS